MRGFKNCEKLQKAKISIQVPSPAPAAYRRGYFERGLFKVSLFLTKKRILYKGQT